MKKLIERFVNSLGKHKSFSFNDALSGSDVLLILLQMSVWAVRGTIKRLRFREYRGLTMIGCGTKIRHPRHLSVGKNFIVEDYAEIMALSSAGIVCGNNVTIGAFATIKPSNYYGKAIGQGLRIGDNSNIGRYNYVGCSGLITIGRDVMIGPRVSFYAENHNFESTDKTMAEQGVSCEPITVGDDCWIASGSIILAGVTIGTGSIIAAGSVVSKDVPPYSVAAGIPAKVIRSRKG
jgi:acetyltransferase-like isoleucine patch superfamily enzyme